MSPIKESRHASHLASAFPCLEAQLSMVFMLPKPLSGRAPQDQRPLLWEIIAFLLQKTYHGLEPPKERFEICHA